MEQICMFSFLGVNSYLDIRKTRISLGITAIYGVIGSIYILLNREQAGILVLGMIPGLILLGIGKISGEALGMGDGVVVLVSGIYLGIWRTLEFVALAFLLAAVWAGFLMVGKKKGRHTCFPFVPFLFLSYVVICLTRVVEG